MALEAVENQRPVVAVGVVVTAVGTAVIAVKANQATEI